MEQRFAVQRFTVRGFSLVRALVILAFLIAVSGALPGGLAYADTLLGPNLDITSITGPLTTGTFACVGGTQTINPSPTSPNLTITGIGACSDTTISQSETISFVTLNGYAVQSFGGSLTCNVTGGDSLILTSSVGISLTCPTQTTAGTVSGTFTYPTPVTSGTFTITLSNTYASGGSSTLSGSEYLFQLVNTPEPSSLLLLSIGLLALLGLALCGKTDFVSTHPISRI
jgi:hypothetical protein